MRLLLDTQVFLWFLEDSRKLGKLPRKLIAEADEVVVSAASIWEAAIKAGIGKLDVSAENLVAGISASGFTELPVRASHGARVQSLPHHHRDPFDRLLIAQAISEPLQLITADALLRQYSELVTVV
jgi:PIN domain nuclease of toxin-antitoxin system